MIGSSVCVYLYAMIYVNIKTDANGDTSKLLKSNKKMILPRITLTFRQCDVG